MVLSKVLTGAVEPMPRTPPTTKQQTKKNTVTHKVYRIAMIHILFSLAQRGRGRDGERE